MSVRGFTDGQGIGDFVVLVCEQCGATVTPDWQQHHLEWHKVLNSRLVGGTPHQWREDEARINER